MPAGASARWPRWTTDAGVGRLVVEPDVGDKVTGGSIDTPPAISMAKAHPKSQGCLRGAYTRSNRWLAIRNSVRGIRTLTASRARGSAHLAIVGMMPASTSDKNQSI